MQLGITLLDERDALENQITSTVTLLYEDRVTDAWLPFTTRYAKLNFNIITQ